MRFANVDGRACLLVGDQAVDIAQASGGALPADPMAVIGRWADLLDVAGKLSTCSASALEESNLRSPVPSPGSIFGLVANYPPATRPDPPVPMVFAKFAGSVCGPYDEIRLPVAQALPMLAEWTVLEAELAVVIGRRGRRVRAAEALGWVAGFMVAQDITERVHEFGPRGTSVGTMEYASLKSMGKSFDTFCPLGPVLVTLDELPSPRDLVLACKRNGDVVQKASTADLLFDVAELVEFLSAFVTLQPGDVILTGTPAPLGGQLPRLKPGDLIETSIVGIGTLRNLCVADTAN